VGCWYLIIVVLRAEDMGRELLVIGTGLREFGSGCKMACYVDCVKCEDFPV
jgi:hypothetical protein